MLYLDKPPCHRAQPTDISDLEQSKELRNEIGHQLLYELSARFVIRDSDNAFTLFGWQNLEELELTSKGADS